MSWDDIRRALWGDAPSQTPHNAEEFRRGARQAIGVPQRNWSTDNIGMPVAGAPGPISGLNTAPNLGIPVAAKTGPLTGFPEAYVPNAVPPGYAPDPNRGLPPSVASTTPFSRAIAPSMTGSFSGSGTIGPVGPSGWGVVPQGASQAPVQAPQASPSHRQAEIASMAALDAYQRQQAQNSAPAPARAPAPAQSGPVAFQYLDDAGRPVWGYKNADTDDHLSGQGWAIPPGGGLLG